MADMQKIFEQFVKFTTAVKAGKKAIIVHKDFVVISRKKYDEIVRQELILKCLDDE